MVHMVNRSRVLRAEQRRDEFLRLTNLGYSIDDACKEIGVTRKAYENWRVRFRGWYAEVKVARQRTRHALRRFDGSFPSFRQHYLGMPTLWFQLLMIDAIEKAKPGEVTLILIPPGHGKTTLLEDWCTFKLVDDPSFRITVASETVDHSRKIIGRVRERLEPEGPTAAIHLDFGPFAPPEGRSSQPWGATHFNVARKKASDERDFSMNGVGLTGRVQGTRCDLLLLDDIQDVKSIELSDKYYEIIVQSFLTRPEMFGRTVIIGTRVGEFDVYRKLIDNQIADHVVKIPAYNVAESPSWPHPELKPDDDDYTTWPPEGVKFLWPERYSPIAYAKLRFRVGRKAWERNYMQRPEAASAMTFSEEVTERLKDEIRGVDVNPRPLANGNKAPIVLSLDPAIGGGNGILVSAMYPERMEVLDGRLDYNLTSYSQIFELLDQYAWRYTTASSKIVECVIEDKAFQRGLLTDDQLIELQRRYGFRIVPNTTGGDKVDSDIGIPAMPESIRRGEITIPWGSAEAQLRIDRKSVV